RGQRFVVAALVAQREAQLVPRIREAGAERDGLTEAGLGGLPVLDDASAHTAVVRGVGADGRDGLAAGLDGGRARLGCGDRRAERERDQQRRQRGAHQTLGLKLGVPTQPDSETSTMMPSGPEYFTSTLPPWRRSPMEEPSSALLTSSRLGAPAAC